MVSVILHLERGTLVSFRWDFTPPHIPSLDVSPHFLLDVKAHRVILWETHLPFIEA